MNKSYEITEKIQCLCARKHLNKDTLCHNFIKKPIVIKGIWLRVEESICTTCLNNCLED